VFHFQVHAAGLAPGLHDNIQDVLCIGLGVGIVPMEFAARARVEWWKSTGRVPLAVRFFDLQTTCSTEHLMTRHFLNRCRGSMTSWFWTHFWAIPLGAPDDARGLMASSIGVLRPCGTTGHHSFTESEPRPELLRRLLAQTDTQSVFRAGAALSGERRYLFVATDRTRPKVCGVPDSRGSMPRSGQTPKRPLGPGQHRAGRGGRVVDGRYTPFEFYDARNREAIRRHLAISARR